MKRFENISLLTKTSLIYLAVTLLAFFSVAAFLTHEANEFIDKELDHRYAKEERKAAYHIRTGKSWEFHAPYTLISALATPPDTTLYPVYADTAILNAESEQLEDYRRKKTVLQVADAWFELVMLSSIEDFTRFRNDIFGSIIPAFLLLALGIVGFNYFLSGYLFRPFNKILSQMKAYQTGKGMVIEKEPTSTSEFVRMQHLFHRMIERIDQDYNNLKEYTENMAHEMQTPLAVMLNKTENLIADEAVMKTHAPSVKIMYEEVNHLSRLGSVLNLLTKIENREFNNAIPTKTRTIIEQHVEAVRELASLKSMQIDLQLSDEHLLIIDPFLFDIIVKNLLRNAIRYGSTESIITIRTAGGVMSLGNDGPPLEVSHKKLFERFYRNANDNGSLGLGLALVKKICDVNDLQIDYQYIGGQHSFSISELKTPRVA